MKQTTNIHIEKLKELKHKLESKQMSTLIGAGFSMNVSEIFPLWSDLLYDMTYFLYGKEIEEAYSNTPLKRRVKKDEFLQEKIKNYINTIGYLNIVSEYNKRKGFSEAIATYIEEKTPKVIEETGKKYLVNSIKGQNNKEDFNESMLDLHRLLINLPWNNIYTTNYDEMLELAIDGNDENNLKSILSEINSRIEQLYNELQALLYDEKKFKTKLHELENNEKVYIDYTNTEKENQTIQYSDEYKKIKQKLSTVEYSILSKKNQIEQSDKELIKVKKELDKCLKVVVHSSELGIKRNKNLIKLHGTLRKENTKYGFDNDSQNHYIISKEDYESYPQKHEAFTQLMRISLLQESYCLIGFSGDDPNFLEWVKWVRDVLEKQEVVDKTHKIYLINLGKNDLSKEKELFFENHSIFSINLDNEEVISFLEKEVDFKFNSNSTNRRKEILRLLLNYFKNDDFDSPNIFLEQHKAKKYDELWDNLKELNLQKINIDQILESYDQIVTNHNFYKIKSQDDIYSNNKKNLLIYSIRLLQDLNKEKDKQSKLLDIILIAFLDITLPYNRFWSEEDILFVESILINNEQKNMYGKVKLRTSVLQGNKIEFSKITNEIEFDENFLNYEKIVLNAFLLNFKEVKSILKKWNPNITEYILKKAGLLSFFKISQAVEYLKEKKEFFENGKTKDLLFFYQYLSFLKIDIGFYSTKQMKLNSSISIFENKGYKGIYKYFDDFNESLKGKEEKINHYGAGRFTISNEVIFSNALSKEDKAIQYIQLLIELGLPLRSNFYVLQEDKKWYEAFKLIFEEYPIPCLYYSLQYNSEKLIRRIAQDYVFSDKLANFITKKLPELLDIYLDEETPHNTKKTILYFCSELFIGVDSNLWEDKFLKIWKLNQFQKNAFDYRKNEEYMFIVKGIPYTKNVKTFRAIVASCLDNINEDTSIDFLYHVAKNTYFNKSKSFQTTSLSKNINQIIQKLSKDELNWFIIGNLNDILTDEQLNKIDEQIENINLDSLNSVNVWRILFYYLKKKPSLKTKFKKGLIRNKNLFNSGLNEDGSLSMGNYHIELNFLNNKRFWNKSEAIAIYNRLLNEFEKIEKWKTKGDNNSFKSILQEMLLFLESENQKLKDIDTYESLKHKVLNQYNKDKEYSKLTEAFSLNEKNKIIWALAEMSLDIKKKDNKNEINISFVLLLNRILSKNLIALEAIVNYIAVWINDKQNKHFFTEHKTLLLLILDNYSNDFPENVDVPFLQKQLIKLAEGYKKLFGKTIETEAWENIKKSRRFFN